MSRQSLFLRLLAALLTAGTAFTRAAPADYAGQDLGSKDFRNENLNGANFAGANLASANLGNATCKNANFRDANLTGADLRQAMLEGADFTGAKLQKANLGNAKMRYAKLPGVELYLALATMPDYSMINDSRSAATLEANVETTSGALTLEHADLSNSLFRGNADGVDFRYANLQGADLSTVQNLDKARLRGATYDANTRWKIDPAQMGAILVAENNGGGAPKSDNPLVGKWIILKELGVTKTGLLKIQADKTYEWDYSAKADVAKGEWSEEGGKLLLKRGEKGSDWVVTVKGRDEILLEAGSDARSAIRSQEK